MALNRRVGNVRRNQIIHWLIVIALVVVTIDIFVGNYQSHLLAAKRAAQAEIERMAWFYVRSDIDKVTYTPDNKYQLTLWIDIYYPVCR